MNSVKQFLSYRLLIFFESLIIQMNRVEHWWATASTRANQLIKLTNSYANTSATNRAIQSKPKRWSEMLRVHRLFYALRKMNAC